jgi:hypothetical protein
MKWRDGSPMSRLSVVLFYGFVPVGGICFLLSYLPSFKNIWIVPVILLIIALYISATIDERRYRKSLQSQYERNAPKHPKVFADEPAIIEPENIADDQLFSLFDRATADHIGDIPGTELRLLITCFKKWGHESNDFFVMPETVVVLRAEGLEQSVAQLLEAAIEKRQDAIEVRWVEKKSY